MITYNSEGVRMPKIKKRDTSAWIKAVAASYGRKVGEIGYLFVDDEKILEVNREYLGHDYYTDVITFDYDEDDTVSGDIVISLDTVRSNAQLFGKTSSKRANISKLRIDPICSPSSRTILPHPWEPQASLPSAAQPAVMDIRRLRRRLPENATACVCVYYAFAKVLPLCESFLIVFSC